MPNFNANEELPEQETVVFSQPAQDFANTQSVSPTLQTVSTDDEQLFGKYEIKNWDYTPRIYKIFAASAIFNLLFLFAVAQTDVLRTKACDSPLVGGFCQVLDTLYVGGKVLSGDNEFAEKPYEPNDIQNAEIVWVDKTGIEPPLNYPAGYFQISNPEMFVPQSDPMNPANSSDPNFPTIVNTAPMPNPTSPNPTIPQINTRRNNGGFLRPQKLPKVKGNEIPNGLPEGITLPGTEADVNGKNNKSDIAKKDPKKDDKETSKQPDIKSESIADFRPNKLPLKDLAKDVLQKRRDEKSNFDLSKNFSIEMNAVLTEDGKFDPKKTAYNPTRLTGDEKMINIAKSAMEKIGDSQVFYYLKSLGVDKINFVLEQNDQGIRAVIKANMPNKERAKSISSGFNGLMLLADTNVKEEDKDLKNSAQIGKISP